MTTRHPGRRRQHRASAAIARTYAALAHRDAQLRGCTCPRPTLRHYVDQPVPRIELAHDETCPVIACGDARTFLILPSHRSTRTPENPVGVDELQRRPRPAHHHHHEPREDSNP